MGVPVLLQADISRQPPESFPASFHGGSHGSFSLLHWIIVLLLMLAWSYPLAAICKKAGKPAATGWILGTIGLLVGGPFWCIWWLALSSWNRAAPFGVKAPFKFTRDAAPARRTRRNGPETSPNAPNRT